MPVTSHDAAVRARPSAASGVGPPPSTSGVAVPLAPAPAPQQPGSPGGHRGDGLHVRSPTDHAPPRTRSPCRATPPRDLGRSHTDPRASTSHAQDILSRQTTKIKCYGRLNSGTTQAGDASTPARRLAAYLERPHPFLDYPPERLHHQRRRIHQLPTLEITKTRGHAGWSGGRSTTCAPTSSPTRSRRPGTPAARWPGRSSTAVAESRRFGSHAYQREPRPGRGAR